MENLIKYKHKSDELYKKFELEYKENGVDFFSCYRNGKKDCLDCETTFEYTFLNILSRLTINSEWNFMDCGCGLGFPMYLASRKFKKVYGIEMISQIAEKAQNNLKKMNVQNFEIINSDMRQIDEETLRTINVFYLFNPCVNDVFEQFISRIVNSLRCGKEREIWLIYANAVCEDIMDNFSDFLPLAFSINDFRKINFYHHKT